MIEVSHDHCSVITFRVIQLHSFNCTAPAYTTYGSSMNYQKRTHTSGQDGQQWKAGNIVEIERKNFLSVVENICTQSRYPLLALRIFIHIICGIDSGGEVHISARQMAKKLDAHYDTVTKCLKHLREIEAIRFKQ